MSSLGNSPLMPLIIAVPNVSLTLISTAVLAECPTPWKSPCARPAGLSGLCREAGRRQQQPDLEIGRRLRHRVTQRQRRADQGGAREGCRAEAAAGEGDAAGHGVPP